MNKQRQLNDEQRKLVVSHIRMACSIACDYIFNGVDYEDLCQDGCYALCLASLNYDVTQDKQFSTYAYPYVEGYIKDVVHRKICENMVLSKMTFDDLYNSGDIVDEYTIKDFMERIKPLTDEEQYIIKSFIGIGEEKKTITELGMKLNKERHTVSKIIKNAIDKIKPKKNPQNSINP